MQNSTRTANCHISNTLRFRKQVSVECYGNVFFEIKEIELHETLRL